MAAHVLDAVAALSIGCAMGGQVHLWVIHPYEQWPEMMAEHFWRFLALGVGSAIAGALI